MPSPGTGVVRLVCTSQERAEARRDEDAGMSPVPHSECPARILEQTGGCELHPGGTTLGLPPALCVPCPPARVPLPCPPAQPRGPREVAERSRLCRVPAAPRPGCAASRLLEQAGWEARPGAAPRCWMRACRWAFLPAASEAVTAFREVFCNHLLQRVTAINGTGFEELTVKAAC